MRYYDLDINGWPRASFARTQPGKNLQHLPDQPTEHHRWDGEQWIEDILPSVWYERIAFARERRLNMSISVPLSDGDFTIPVSDRSAALAPAAARNARADGKTRPFPTDRGVVERGADDLDRIEGALDAYLTGVWRRVAELEQMVADGTITESDLDEGWG